MFEQASPVVARLRAASRAESQAAGQRLAAIGELDLLWLRRFGERETWCTDSQDAITAEVAAALGITQARAASYLDYARAMRLRLPRVGALLVAGDIDYRMFQTIVYRTDLITDPEVMAAVDAELAVKAPRWPALTQGRLGAKVDRIVARATCITTGLGTGVVPAGQSGRAQRLASRSAPTANAPMASARRWLRVRGSSAHTVAANASSR